MASYDTTGLKSWTNNGQTYYLWNGGQKPVYSYNDLVRMVKEFGDKLSGGKYVKEQYKKVSQGRLNDVLKYLNAAGASTDEPIVSELDALKLDPSKAYFAGLTQGREGDGGAGNRFANWSAGWTPIIATEESYRKMMKGDLADRIAKGAIIAGGLALTAGGLSGALGGVNAAGQTVAGSLWSPAGATAGGSVATASPVALTSAEGITASPLAPLAGTGGGAATGGLVTAGEAAAAASGGSILKGIGGAVSGLGSLLAPAANAILGTIGYQNNKDAYNDAYNAQKDYLDKMLGLVDEQRQNNEQRYQQARQDVIDYYQQARGDAQPYYQAGIGGLDALGNYYGNSANVWGELGNLAGVNGREGQQAAINMIENSPAFEAMVKQGENAILQNAAATGGLRGGNTQYALAQFRPQILSGLMDKQYNQLSGMANQGMSAANSAASIGGNAMNSLINASVHTGQTLGDIGVRAGNTDAGFLTNMMNIYGKMSDAEKNLILAQAQNRNDRNAGYGNAIGQAVGALPAIINGIKGIFG